MTGAIDDNVLYWQFAFPALEGAHLQETRIEVEDLHEQVFLVREQVF
jgi:hypothetical protein